MCMKPKKPLSGAIHLWKLTTALLLRLTHLNLNAS